MSELDALVDSLLWEGYALYPYTPGATKNATPTPFGIVYPPAYAAGAPHTFDHLQLECVLVDATEAGVEATVRFLQGLGERHQAVERRVDVSREAPEAVIDLPPLAVRVSMEQQQLDDPARRRVTLRVENLTPVVAAGMDRAEALRHALLSTHVMVRAHGGRFVSPLEAEGCANVNTYPVLATPEDDVVLGAAIVLPDHPQLAPESRGGLFDSTEIEEALLLHVLALSDGERAEIEHQDPAVREMIARAQAATPEDLWRLHGRLSMGDPGGPRQ